MIGVYKVYENWSTEAFREKPSKKRAVCCTYRRLVNLTAASIWVSNNNNSDVRPKSIAHRHEGVRGSELYGVFS